MKPLLRYADNFTVLNGKSQKPIREDPNRMISCYGSISDPESFHADPDPESPKQECTSSTGTVQNNKYHKFCYSLQWY
jgi:hypothetical protein